VLEFAYPWAVLLLPLPILAWWLLPPRREQVGALRVPFFDEVVGAAGADARPGSVVRRRRWLQMLVAILAWALLVAAAAKPQWIGEPIVRTEASRDIMLAIDLSGSMAYRDFPGADGENLSRLAAVQSVVSEFIAARESDRIGLIAFGDKAYIQLPFTRDLATALALTELMDVAMAGPQTALGDSIGLAIHAFEDSAVDDRLLILLTDGNDTASTMTPLNAAEIARINGITIYPIGIGDPAATGEDRVDFGLLEDIARRTGGRFYRAENEAALADVYRRIDEAAVADVRTQSWRPRLSLVHYPAGAALVLLFAGYLLLLLVYRPRNRPA
jgi:Ca-activated chloride channel family protein